MQAALLAGAVFAVSFVLCAALVPPCRALALRTGVVDEPGGRRLHTRTTPRLGGIAIFVTFLGVVLTGYWLTTKLGASGLAGSTFGQAALTLREAWRVESKLFALAAGGVVVFLVGMADDVFGARFPVLAKLAGQLAAALIVASAGVRTTFLPYEWMNVAVTVLWIIGISNAFNLLDNMDGLAAGVAFLSAGALLVNAWSLGAFFICLILCAFMGSLLGFLIFNVPPASVFMGDGGSLFIGFAMATITLLATYVSKASSSLFPVVMPVLVLAVPIVDTITVIAIRLLDGRPIYVGDHAHLSHRLVALGLSKPAAVATIYLLTLCLGLGAVSLTEASLFQSALVLIQALVFIALILVLMFAPGRPPRPEGP